MAVIGNGNPAMLSWTETNIADNNLVTIISMFELMYEAISKQQTSQFWFLSPRRAPKCREFHHLKG